jgi:peptide/nickel transport system ATP-binding protein
VNTPAFVVEKLSVAYRQTSGARNVVVWDFAIELEAGKVVGLAGESGCGKSTAALTSMGYRPGRSEIIGGSARLGGMDLLSMPDARLRELWGKKIAYVAQNAGTSLSPVLSIGRQLADPLRRHLSLRGAALRRRQLHLLQSLAIPDPEQALGRFPHQFSGGQQQRIALAIALACEPAVLILDEPTTGLDVTTQAQVSSLLRSLLCEEGFATLYVSHDLALLSDVSDRLAVMYAGEVVEEGRSVDVIGNPSHPYTSALIACVPSALAPRSVVGIRGRPPSGVRLHECAFLPRCTRATPECGERRVELHSIGNRRVRCIHAVGPGNLLALEAGGVDLRFSKNGLRSSAPLLTVSELCCTYARADRQAIADLSVEVAPGEILGVVGESGSGKSTLLRAICGLLPPRSGEIRLNGIMLAPSARRRPRETRRAIQIVFQNPDSALNPRHSVFQLLRRPLRLFRDDVPRGAEERTVLELLEAVQLPRAVLHRYPAELSGGQKQRVALAGAFAARPDLLLCDEVTSALDVSVQARILELVQSLSSSFQTAVVFVSHDLGVVRTIAERAIVMRNGVVCEEGLIEDLFGSPRHAYTRELLAALPHLENVRAS